MVQQLAEESPELRKKILGNVDRNVALVSAIESASSAMPPLLMLDVRDAAGFETALKHAGQRFIEHTTKLGIIPSHMSRDDARVAFAALLGTVIEARVSLYPNQIVIGPPETPNAHDLIEVDQSGGLANQQREVAQLHRFAALCERTQARRGALVLMGSPHAHDGDVVIAHRVMPKSDRDLFIVHL